MPFRLRAAVHGKMLGACRGFEVGGVIPLQAFDVGCAEKPRQKRILPIGFLPAPPAWVAVNIEIGGPHRQPLIDAVIASALAFIEFSARLRGNRFRNPENQRFAEGGRHADRLGENSGHTCPRDPVQALVPPIIGQDVEARNAFGSMHELGDQLDRVHLTRKRFPNLQMLLFGGWIHGDFTSFSPSLRSGFDLQTGFALRAPTIHSADFKGVLFLRFFDIC